MREIVLDTETTGFDPANGDRMVEVAAVEMVERVLTGRHFHCYFNPERDMPAGAEAIHGLTSDFLADKPRFAEKAADLMRFIGEAPIVAHNAGFDWRFLTFELERAGHGALPYERMVDTLEIARRRFPGAKHSLDALCQRFGIDRSMRVKHGALIDAELLADVYVELTGGRQIGLALAVAVEVQAPVETRRVVRLPRPHAASAEELQRHAAFVAAMREPVWQRISS
ncbi:DNA polymerase III subunit epsilon [Sandaracinobacteroides saxicola]|uniref:DNA polymerase III subunit epsilon n=1 Tax=Sandaracinobacteroides saxicola TaxID=2759707 RepID=A0A7G5IHV0_9SPHN|nr:DNA polymerase III subunit epsilon [Sandaracinobacteroides saxicola]QMW22942.1 DNA polymerase III subunit epsilon [Sandaracinobacteroides saxicola]